MDVIIFNLPDRRQNKTNAMNVSIHEKVGLVFDKFRKYHTRILLRDFVAKLGRKFVLQILEDIAFLKVF
jgi:hypothetical protein